MLKTIFAEDEMRYVKEIIVKYRYSWNYAALQIFLQKQGIEIKVLANLHETIAGYNRF